MLQPGAVPTKVVCLTQVVTPDELLDDEEYDDIMEDMRQEGGKFGNYLQFHHILAACFSTAIVLAYLLIFSLFSLFFFGVYLCFTAYSSSTLCYKESGLIYKARGLHNPQYFFYLPSLYKFYSPVNIF